MIKVAVIGGGLMGHGIALTFARAGHAVTVTDPVPEALASVPQRIGQSLDLLGASEEEIKEAQAQVSLADSIGHAVASADVVFEAAPEKLELKQQLFSEIEAVKNKFSTLPYPAPKLNDPVLFSVTSMRSRILSSYKITLHSQRQSHLLIVLLLLRLLCWECLEEHKDFPGRNF